MRFATLFWAGGRGSCDAASKEHDFGFLMRCTTLLALGLSLLISACATTTSEPKLQAAQPAEPELIAMLPEELGTFEYAGYRFFEDSANGYTFRYANNAKRRIADVYVYPVATENASLGHSELVMGSTRATIQAIGEAVKQGLYANFNVVGAATVARGARTVARVEATYLRENLASYTLVYQTEYEGTLLKIRVSMPDNEANRASPEWDEFAKTMFNQIVEQLEAESVDAKTFAAADT